MQIKNLKLSFIITCAMFLQSCVSKEIHRLPQGSFKNFAGVEVNVIDIKARKYYSSTIKSLHPCNDCYFLEFFFTLKNIGKQSINFNTDRFSILDESQNEYLPSVDANTRLAMTGKKDLIDIIQLHPQIEKNFILAYEVPKSLVMDHFVVIGEINGFKVYFPGGAKYVESNNETKRIYIQKILNSNNKYTILDLP